MIIFTQMCYFSKEVGTLIWLMTNDSTMCARLKHHHNAVLFVLVDIKGLREVLHLDITCELGSVPLLSSKYIV